MASEVKILWDLADFLRVATAIVVRDKSPNKKFTFVPKTHPIDDISKRAAYIELTLDPECTMRCGPTHAYVTGLDGLSAIYELYVENLENIPSLTLEQTKYFRDVTYENVRNAFDLLVSKVNENGGALGGLLGKKHEPGNTEVEISANWMPQAPSYGMDKNVDVLCFPALFLHYKKSYSGNPTETWKYVATRVFPWDPNYALSVARFAWDKFNGKDEKQRKEYFLELSECALKSGRFDKKTEDDLKNLVLAKKSQPGAQLISVQGIKSEDIVIAKKDVESLKKSALGGGVLIRELAEAKDDDEKKLRAYGKYRNVGIDPTLTEASAMRLNNLIDKINSASISLSPPISNNPSLYDKAKSAPGRLLSFFTGEATDYGSNV